MRSVCFPVLLVLSACTGAPAPAPPGAPDAPAAVEPAPASAPAAEAPAAEAPAAEAPSKKLASIVADPAGIWNEDVDVFMPAYGDQATCEEVEGTWKEERCTMGGGSSIEIGAKTDAGWPVQITVVGSNAHLCDVSGVAAPVADALVMTTDDCVVNMTFDEGKLAAVGSDGCSAFCGQRARIAVKAATRP